MVIEATRRSCKPSYTYFYPSNLGFAGCDDILLLELPLVLIAILVVLVLARA